MFLLDTNTVSDYLKGSGRVGERFRQVPAGQITISSVTAYELFCWAEHARWGVRRVRALDAFVAALETVRLDLAEARTAAILRARMEQQGNPLGPLDHLIAGIAVHHNMTLITRNLAEFKRVPGLRIENWHG